MSQIRVTDLTFGYEGAFENIFENVSFTVDTSWKLGFIGRNGKGKTTFLNILMGKYDYKGNISTAVRFDYFPYKVSEEEYDLSADELMEKWKSGVEGWKVMCELPKLSIDAELLYRPFRTLSFGERTKIMLAVLFSDENDFLLIDEPTNHLDQEAREIVKKYLSEKKGFILVSHDRDLLDACIDHVLVLNRATIELQKGHFSSWWENKQRADSFSRAENDKHLKEIDKLKAAADRTARWAEKSENTKIGFDPVKEHDRSISARAFIGAKTKKMQSRVKSFEKRTYREIEEKEGLLNDIEETIDLKVMPLEHYKKRLIEAKDVSIRYNDGQKNVVENLTFELLQGERIFITGENGSGKSTLIRAIFDSLEPDTDSRLKIIGTLNVAPNLKISYINQDTSFLRGKLKEYAKEKGIDYSLFLAILRQLDMDRVQFEKNMKDFSEGQKKKVLIASSLLTPAHVYIWDEPLNYIDVFSRIQIEKLIENYHPTMLIVEHDARFREKLADKVVELY
ncbi:lincosamide and streptogramin A transport system ATP-binding/permease protein [Lachnospiraceae bacterium]|nr:lincosamide and streptogramin A transport system ATP-binding/permease protein [Lachnospiraceae bacterium]